jgi:hypothetical protein
MSITKNDNGTLSIGTDIQIVSSYDKETKKHKFNLLKAGCVPVIHEGNHLTLRNNLSKLVAELESTFVSETGEVAPEEATESIHDDILALVEFVEITIDDNTPTSESEDYNLFKEYLEKFVNALTQEERDAAADSAMVLAINMDIAAV